MPVSAEFLCLSGILQNSVLARTSNKGTNTAYFGRVSGGRTVCIHDFTMKYMTTTRALMGGTLKILSLSEILPVYLVNRLYLSFAVTGDKYCIYVRVQGGRKN